MSEGLMHGQTTENLVMGLFNLDFALDDFEDSLSSRACNQVRFEEVPEWVEVRHGITHESMATM